MRDLTLGLVVILVGAGAGLAQDAEQGKQACLRFLSKGELAPRPELKARNIGDCPRAPYSPLGDIMLRDWSPVPGCSSLMTSAPCRANMYVA